MPASARASAATLELWQDALRRAARHRRRRSCPIRPTTRSTGWRSGSIRPRPASRAWALPTALAAGDPPVIVRDHEVEHGHFFLDPCNLHPGEAEIVADAIVRASPPSAAAHRRAWPRCGRGPCDDCWFGRMRRADRRDPGPWTLPPHPLSCRDLIAASRVAGVRQCGVATLDPAVEPRGDREETGPAPQSRIATARRPAGRGGADLHRQAAHREPGRRQHLQVVQLLNVAVADLAAGLVALPDQAGVARLAVRSRACGRTARASSQPSVPVTRTPRSSR